MRLWLWLWLWWVGPVWIGAPLSQAAVAVVATGAAVSRRKPPSPVIVPRRHASTRQPLGRGSRGHHHTLTLVMGVLLLVVLLVLGVGLAVL